MVQGDGDDGRDHHLTRSRCGWRAAASARRVVHGESDELGFNVVDGRSTSNDPHATILHQLGFDHERFTYRFRGLTRG